LGIGEGYVLRDVEQNTKKPKYLYGTEIIGIIHPRYLYTTTLVKIMKVLRLGNLPTLYWMNTSIML